MKPYGKVFQDIAAKEQLFPALQDYMSFVECEKALDVLTENNFLTPTESAQYFEQLKRKFQLHIINTGLKPENVGFAQIGSASVNDLQKLQRKQKVQAELNAKKTPWYSDEWYRAYWQAGLMTKEEIPAEIQARLRI